MLKKLLRERDGQDMVEYGLLVAVVALGTVAALSQFSNVINSVWTVLTARLSS